MPVGEVVWKGPPKRVNSPVAETGVPPGRTLSTTGHEKPRGNQGGPPPKAKYSLATDSEPVP